MSRYWWFRLGSSPLHLFPAVLADRGPINRSSSRYTNGIKGIPATLSSTLEPLSPRISWTRLCLRETIYHTGHGWTLFLIIIEGFSFAISVNSDFEIKTRDIWRYFKRDSMGRGAIVVENRRLARYCLYRMDLFWKKCSLLRCYMPSYDFEKWFIAIRRNLLTHADSIPFHLARWRGNV